MTFDTSAFRQDIERPDGDAGSAAEERQLRLTKPAGALGQLEQLAVWLAAAQGQCPPRPLDQVRVVVFAGDHGVARAGVSAYPSEVTRQLVRSLVAGGGAVNAVARSVGASVRVLDLGVDADLAGLPPSVHAHKVTRGTGDITVENAMSLDESARAFAAGVAVADEEIDSGADVLVPGGVGVGSTTPASALVGLLTNNDAGGVTGRGSGIDDAAWMRKAAAVRDAMRRGRGTMGDQVELLATVGGPDLAAMTGLLLQAAIRRTPVILDGLVSSAAALVAHRMAFRSSLWWLAGHLSPEPGHALALKRLQLEPIVEPRVSLGDGTGALLALPLLRAAQATLAEMATLDETGVSHPSTSSP
jgi:nicotinate-nucleotide--dimethylbenzimidazole phosphoribosyltransferase